MKRARRRQRALPGPAAGRSGEVKSLTSQDNRLIRSAARSIGVQIAVASAFAVAVATLLAFALIHRHPEAGRPDSLGHLEPPGDRDALVRNALIAAAGLGIVIAGVIGFLIARRAVRPLGQALALQRRFVADAGHELRTPLTVLHTRAQLLARRIPVDDPARQIADQLLDDSRLLSEIVDELLLSATMSVNPGLGEEVDPAALLADVADSLQVLADDATVTLRLSLDPTLLIRGSRPALRRALIALVDNAISHSFAGGTVSLGAAASGREVLLTVTDQGAGLSPGSGEQVWNRFSRGSDSEVAEGSRPIGNRRYGLGLALVREIATAHGGTVSLVDAGSPADAGSPGDGRSPDDGGSPVDAGSDEPRVRGAVATMTLPLAGRRPAAT